MSILGLGGDSGSGSSGYNSILECCDGVVDPLTLLAVLGSIIGLTVFLRQAIIDKVPGRKKRRKREFSSVPQMYNLLMNETDEHKKYELYQSIFQIVSRMLEGDNYFDMAFAGRLPFKENNLMHRLSINVISVAGYLCTFCYLLEHPVLNRWNVHEWYNAPNYVKQT